MRCFHPAYGDKERYSSIGYNVGCVHARTLWHLKNVKEKKTYLGVCHSYHRDQFNSDFWGFFALTSGLTSHVKASVNRTLLHVWAWMTKAHSHICGWHKNERDNLFTRFCSEILTWFCCRKTTVEHSRWIFTIYKQMSNFLSLIDKTANCLLWILLDFFTPLQQQQQLKVENWVVCAQERK